MRSGGSRYGGQSVTGIEISLDHTPHDVYRSDASPPASYLPVTMVTKSDDHSTVTDTLSAYTSHINKLIEGQSEHTSSQPDGDGEPETETVNTRGAFSRILSPM